MAKKDIWKNFALYVDGDRRIGNVISCELPSITVTEADHRPGGSDGTIGIDMGIDKMQSTIVYAGYSEDAGKVARIGVKTRLTMRGALESDEDGITPVEVILEGPLVSLTPGTIVVGSSAESSIVQTVEYFKMTKAGVVDIEIDIDNVKRIIGGEDQLEGIRDALGF